MKPNPVNHPSHYTQGAIECIEALKSALPPEQFAGFCRGNGLKYLWRAGHKGNTIQDLEKAKWYIDAEIEHRKKVSSPLDSEVIL